MEHQEELEDQEQDKSERRFRTPERPPPTKRHHETEDDAMGDESKQRRIQDYADMSAVGPMGEKPWMEYDWQMTEDERKIIASAIVGVDITDVYSPVRVGELAAKYGMRPGSSFDLTNGWDFTKEAHRARAWKQIKQEQPYCIIG